MYETPGSPGSTQQPLPTGFGGARAGGWGNPFGSGGAGGPARSPGANWPAPVPDSSTDGGVFGGGAAAASGGFPGSVGQAAPLAAGEWYGDDMRGAAAPRRSDDAVMGVNAGYSAPAAMQAPYAPAQPGLDPRLAGNAQFMAQLAARRQRQQQLGGPASPYLPGGQQEQQGPTSLPPAASTPFYGGQTIDGARWHQQGYDRLQAMSQAGRPHDDWSGQPVLTPPGILPKGNPYGVSNNMWSQLGPQMQQRGM